MVIREITNGSSFSIYIDAVWKTLKRLFWCVNQIYIAIYHIIQIILAFDYIIFFYKQPPYKQLALEAFKR